MIRDPIFIVGTERSGSNLLRMILNSHSHITVPHPPHIVRYFAPLERSYGDLANDRAFRVLVRDVVRLVRAHIYPWEVAVTEEETLRMTEERSVLGVHAAIYEQHRRATGKARWGCKSTFMIDHVPALLALFPGAKIILLVRDPRDVAASSRRSVFSTFHPYFTAQLWRRQQAIGARLLDTLTATQIHLLHYEELVAAPPPSLLQLCAFLGEPFEEPMLDFASSPEARRSARLAESWQRTGEPITTTRVAAWRSELTDEEVALVESVAGDLMARFGYEPEHSSESLAQVRITASDRARFHLEEALYRLRVERRSLARDENVWLRWRRDALMSLLSLRRHLPANG